ncbi:MAG: AraC family transcriptional regulator ligand-binding domain-containing protein [Acidobacteriota bacterium]
MMKHPNSFTLPPGWRVLLKDLGLPPVDVLRRAGLPDDLLTRETIHLSTEEYFEFWRGLDREAADPLLPIRIGQSISVEVFDVPIFAAVCSPNLNVAARRISRYKRLIGPMALHVEEDGRGTTLEIEFLDKSWIPPRCLIAMELVFFVQLARLATREEVRPAKVIAPEPPEPARAYTEYFGCQVERGDRRAVTFSTRDAKQPFLTANAKMWEFFEPELRKRLSELDETATVTDRVRGALLELLPSGNPSLQAVSKKLAVSTRTLQRRLGVEGQTFQRVLDSTREELARHYLGSSAMSGAEISFLLGFEDPNSFFRAFHTWTGETPEQARTAMAAVT